MEMVHQGLRGGITAARKRSGAAGDFHWRSNASNSFWES
jgi:hypothetical protein